MAGRKAYTPEQRIAVFWRRIEKTPDGCWLWTAAATPSGYGVIHLEDNRSEYAHRLAYILAYGDPGDMSVLHTCDTALCCNPAHLYLGTSAERYALMVSRGRHNPVRGEQHPRHKPSDAQVADIRARYAAGGVTQQRLADEYGLHYSTVSYIVNGKRRA